MIWIPQSEASQEVQVALRSGLADGFVINDNLRICKYIPIYIYMHLYIYTYIHIYIYTNVEPV